MKNEIRDKTEDEQKIKTKLEKEEFQATISNSVQKLQQNVFNQQNRSINMAENGEAPEEQEKKVVEAVDEDAIVIKEEPTETVEDLAEYKIEPEETKKDEEERKDKDEVKEERKDKDEDKEERENKDEDKEERKDKDEGKENKVDDKDEDKIKDESDLIGEPLLHSTLVIAKDETISFGGLAESIISSPLLTDDMITKLKAMDERCIILVDEIQQLKREVQELLEKSELTEEDTFEIQKKQDVIMSKVAELEQLTQKFHETQVQQIEDLSSEIEIIKEKEEEEVANQIDQIEAFKKVLEKDFFELPQIEYPEDKLPRIIFCGYTEDKFPKVVIAESERKGKVKCLEKLTGKLTESLTMQEKLVKENAQLEGGRYKLEEALLEKDTALENLQRKVCNLQAEMRIIVEENTELNRQLAILNQLVTRSTRCCTCSGITPSSPTSPSSLPPRSHVNVQFRDDVYCQCKCCLQSQFDILSPTTETDSPRLTGGGSKTEDHYFTDNSALQNVEMCSRSPVTVKSSLPRGMCPAELEDKLALYGTNTKQLEQQLGSMETEVRNMQMELANVQKERQQLEQQRKLLKCTGPCAPCSCCPPPPSICVKSVPGLPSMPPKASAISAVSTAQLAGTDINAQQQLRDLREQYARLQDDYKSKLCEVSCMRTEAEKMKQDTRDAKEEKERMEIKLIDAQERLKLLESEKGKFDGNKEQLIEKEQALIVAKQRFREAQDELEELRSLIQDQAAQLEDYRNKYLQAQQQVEEQRRQLDLMEMDNARMNENVTLEIGRVKNQFQEKLAELAPLPDILKQMQIKMQEAQQMRLIAERNSEDLSRELLGYKDKIQTLQNQLDVLHTEHRTLQDERGHGSGKFDEMEKKYSELRHENERMKHTVARFEEHEAQLQKRIDEKMHENTQLSSMLDQIREDSARQVARTKERCETMRRSMQGQISEMERQLAQCRATARAAQRDRDEIRQKMQGQITNLNEAFKHAQGRIKSLQGHVNYLKTSYSNIFLGQGETPTGALPGDDSCDCNY
ncbi:outer dense fiber protein 2 isoform X2 [Linepithema humile]|uniref:outer dense fiber protein 2 isoform X2 n=1 Tax=Linepithema humile TaxID=83485 RepID=UPI00351F47CB